jgi:hypothetical protein
MDYSGEMGLFVNIDKSINRIIHVGNQARIAL